MKTRIVVFMICAALIFTFIPKPEASADLGASALTAAAFSMAQAAGINFAFSGFDALGVQEWFQGQIDTYSGGDLSSKFSLDLLKIQYGKIIIDTILASQINLFLHDLIERLDLSDISTNIVASYDGVPILGPENQYQPYGSPPAYAAFDGSALPTGVSAYVSNGSAYLYYNGVQLGYAVSVSHRTYNGVLGYAFYVASSGLQWCAIIDQTYYGERRYLLQIGNLIGGVDRPSANSLTGVLGPTYEGTWDVPEGKQIEISGGWDEDTDPDTIPQDVFDDFAEGTQDIITGEVVDTPVPPTPVPTVAPDTPLADVPWEGLDTIIGTQTGAITESIEGVQEGIEGVQEEVVGLTDVIEEALDVPTSETASVYKWDLTQLFPFCIPFDIANMLEAFDGVATAPHIQIPIVIQSIGFTHTLDLDFSPFDPVAAILRQVELIAFAVALAWGTSKVIRW